ncbi:hypothetical protein N7451_004880 [Penicillium sp. IBT 35674x]|nr:hypothetical protein N7451_004880 [Penicillium sp. IBT 35674x]
MEILVHVSAPSRAQDDARYRAQVAAILAQSTDTRDSPTQSAVHSVSVDRQDYPCGLPRSDHLATPAIPLPESTLTPQPIATKIGSSQASDQRHPRVFAGHMPGFSFGFRSISRISGSTGGDNPPKKRRIDSASQEHGLAIPSTTSIVTTIAPESPPHPDDNHASPGPLLTLIPTVPCKAPHLPPLPLEIRPPPPPISTFPFTSHITPTLLMLTERLKPTRTYNPRYQTRSLDPLERGYWAVHINIWPENQIGQGKDLENRPGPNADPEPAPQINIDGPSEVDQSRDWDVTCFDRFWSFLSEFVGKDARAGWGVWCFLEHAPLPESLSTVTSGEVATHRFVPVLLKVYAWGEVAMHMYLLLFLASERRVRKMGPQWRDSSDAVVIQMP